MYGKHAPPFGAVRDAEREHAPRRRARDVFAFEQRCVRRSARSTPEIAFSVVVLPAPLAPIRLTSSPLLHLERESAHRRDLAVAALEVLNRRARLYLSPR